MEDALQDMDFNITCTVCMKENVRIIQCEQRNIAKIGMKLKTKISSETKNHAAKQS